MSGGSVFVLGSGQIGQATALRFAAGGCRVRVGHRLGGAFPSNLSRLGIEEVFLDREIAGDLSRALGAGADAVVDTIAYTAAHAEQLGGVRDRVGAFVVISSCSVYGDATGRTLDEARQVGFPKFDGPISETQPTTHAGSETYSTRKVAMERALADIDRPVAILRPGAIHGPGCNAPREWWFVKRVLDGRTRVPVAYKGAPRFHTTAAANIAELCWVAIARSARGIFNIGDPDPPSVGEIGRLIAGAMNHSWDIVGLPKHPEGSVGVSPWCIPRDLLINTAKAEALGYSPVVTYASAIDDLCRDLVDRTRIRSWLEAFPGLQAYKEPWFDYEAEDTFLDP